MYAAICLNYNSKILVGDEERYLRYANDLLHGFYSPAAPNVDLWSGRGYPALIAPLVFLKLPLTFIRLLNAILLYLSLVLVFRSIARFASIRYAYLYTIALGLYFPVYENLPLILTECLAWFLISAVCYLFIAISNQKEVSWKTIILAGFTVAFLAMTKIIFGYVILAMLAVSLASCLVKRYGAYGKKAGYVFAIAMALCIPYLVYTYSLTSKMFFWSDSGSMSLFTMSAPFTGDYGDWKSDYKMLADANYHTFADSVAKLSPLAREAAYKEKAVENIKKHPAKYLSNCLANLGRMLFSYPYTDTKQDLKTFYTIIPNLFVTFLMLASILIGLMRFKVIPQALIILFIFIMIYLAGSILVSAMRRMFYITMPFWTIYFSFIFTRIISIKIQKDPELQDLHLVAEHPSS
ncbi:hypothetical protein [Dyadobacter psychrophilus]|uniref:hypothetical protein n=1 Tax=Dyadobacter psychrophilus TaxID=651661 RepID=UPI0011321274|nr:hypothetical protein [Dyadobacter psychrophilus]